MASSKNSDSLAQTVLKKPLQLLGMRLMYIGLLAAFLVIGFLLGKLSVGGNQGGATNTAARAQLQTAPPSQQAPPTNTGPVTVSVDDDPVKGQADAPVTIIEFSDYECPFCKRFFDQTLPQLTKDYIDTGKLKMVYRDLPLAFHEPMATKEAIAANCARAQGDDDTYFEYHDEIFKRTVSNGNGLNDDDLTTIAADIGLDADLFKACQADESQRQEVEKDFADAAIAGATGTPTFFIGKSSDDGNIEGQRIVGAQPYATIRAIVDQELEN